MIEGLPYIYKSNRSIPVFHKSYIDREKTIPGSNQNRGKHIIFKRKTDEQQERWRATKNKQTQTHIIINEPFDNNCVIPDLVQDFLTKKCLVKPGLIAYKTSKWMTMLKKYRLNTT